MEIYTIKKLIHLFMIFYLVIFQNYIYFHYKHNVVKCFNENKDFSFYYTFLFCFKIISTSEKVFLQNILMLPWNILYIFAIYICKGVILIASGEKYSCQKINNLQDILYFMSKYARAWYKISRKLLIFRQFYLTHLYEE